MAATATAPTTPPAPRRGLMWGAWAVVRGAWVVNRLFFLAVAVGFAATWLVPDFFHRLLREASPAVDAPRALIGVRLLMLIGLAMFVAVERLLVPLARLVEAARAGDPFVPASAARLRAIGWALLALQLLDIPCSVLARHWDSLGTAAPAAEVSVGGWLATLMVFVLARVFATGTALRDDLAGTV